MILLLLTWAGMGWYGLATLAGLFLLGNLFTGPLQHHFIFLPRKLPHDYRYQFEESFEELFIKVPHNGQVNALWFKVGKGLSPKGVILFFHGNATSLARWGHLYHYFAQYQYDFFVFDYRGFGKSTGPRSEKILYQDAVEMYQYLRRFYPPERIILYGRSLGSVFAGRVAAEMPARTLILETPFFSMRDLFYAYYPFLPRVFRFRYLLPTYRFLKKTTIPVYIFQGTKDLIVPFSCAAKLQAFLKPGDRFYAVPDAGHNNLLFYDIYNRKVKEILLQE